MKSLVQFLVITPILIALSISGTAQTLRSPESFLGYPLGSHYTPHHRILEYFKYLASASPYIKLQSYGQTYEGRELMVAFVASKENLNRLESIRIHNLQLAGLRDTNQEVNISQPPVLVWLSYNVHGNEPSSSEASMKTAYDLLLNRLSAYSSLFDNTVIVLDPCINPDGRERYISYYNQVMGQVADSDPESREHIEPWPGGRFNHYLFDLNRDWAWQSQTETRQRIKLFNSWLPQVHVDYHEMGINSPYYFSPAAEPFHAVITPWQRSFQEVVGAANAGEFERNGWLYFNREEYDLLYPSYGDTYPTYNGSIGMTYEQAGGPHGGLSVKTQIGDTLTLVQRILHHYTTGIATIRAASLHAEALLKEYKKYFDQSKSSPPGPYKAYIVKFDLDNLPLRSRFTEYLSRNGIAYSIGLEPANYYGFSYYSSKMEDFHTSRQDLFISCFQPKSRLLQALMEPKTFVSDSLTYDITAWALPYAWGLPAYALKEARASSFHPMKTASAPSEPVGTGIDSSAYGYLVRWNGLESVKVLSYLLQKGLKVRCLTESLTLDSKIYGPGTLLITLASNLAFKNHLGEEMKLAVSRFKQKIDPIQTAFSVHSKGFGSREIHFIPKANIGLLAGPSVNASACGEIWEFFDRDLSYPVHLISPENLTLKALSGLSILILADGQYKGSLPAEKMLLIENWVEAGGKLIVVEGAIKRLVGEKGFSIRAKPVDSTLYDGTKNSQIKTFTYENRERTGLRTIAQGAIFAIKVEVTNPLCYGYPSRYFTLKNDTPPYKLFDQGKGWNAGIFEKDSYLSGFCGDLAKKGFQSGLSLGWQHYGSGSVVYFTDDPLFRHFWQNGYLLFANAVFMVGL